MSLSVDLFWSFRSPYSYLGTPRVVALAAKYDLTVNVRPVYPIAIRNPEFFRHVNPLWVPYLHRDIQRVGEFNGLPIKRPTPDPVVMDMKTLAISEEQPYIHRLTRLGVEAVRRGAGLPFIAEVSRLLWGDEVTGWDQGDHLAGAASRAGVELAELEAAVAGGESGYDAEIAENQDALGAAGHWGVPTLVFQGEPFFGQDRIDLCVWRMQQHGLAERHGNGN